MLFCNIDILPKEKFKDYLPYTDNKKIYGRLQNRDLYVQAVLDFISGMTDSFAIKIFNELIRFE